MTRTEQKEQRHFAVFEYFEEITEFFEDEEVSIQDVKEVLGQIVVIYTKAEVV